MRALLAAGAVLLLVLVLTAGVIAWLGGEDEVGTAAAAVRLSGNEPGVDGAAFFEQDGERMHGFVVVWGLEPSSEHAVHFHGPDSACGAKADPVAVHPDLRADANGVAFTQVDVAAAHELLSGGFYYNVHEGPSRVAENPEIACGDLVPAEAETAAG